MRRRIGRLNVRWLVAVIVAPALLGALASSAIDPRALPLVAEERFVGVLLVDGEAYFGHLDDDGTGGDLRLTDVYYFQDAQKGSSGLALGLVKRGSEAHLPTDTMHINRGHVLAVERLSKSSAVVGAIAAERGLGKDRLASPLERRLVADAAALAAQRAAAENALARGYKKAADAIRTAQTELVLPVSAATAADIAAKGVDDLRKVRAAALGALAAAYGMSQGDADVYVLRAAPRLDAPDASTAPLLLAPDLYAVVARADQLYGQASDAAVSAMTKSGK